MEPPTRTADRPPASRRLLLVIAYLGFIGIGLPDTLVGVAWPSVRAEFDLRQSAVALIFVGAGCGYFLSSFSVGRLLERLGVGLLLAGSSALVALGSLGYGLAPVWAAFAACSLLYGLGSGAIDAGLNHYVAHHFSVRHMNWLHAFWSLGATLGPLVMTAAIASAAGWRGGYLAVGAILAALTALFAATRRRWDEPDEPGEPDEPDTAGGPGEEGGKRGRAPGAGMLETLRHPLVRLQVALFFVYAGVEASVGQWSFTILTESRGVPAETAGLWVTVYWASIGVGRILLGAVAERLGVDRLLRLSTLAAALGTALLAWGRSGALSAVALAATGLGLAAIYPSTMTRTPQRLGSALSAHAIGFQVSAAMLGVAVLPSLTGVLAERLGLEAAAAAALGMAAALLLLHEAVLALSRRRGG